VGCVAAQQRRAGADDRPDCHRSSVPGGGPVDDPVVHTWPGREPIPTVSAMIQE
jgi:hypothetical protein